MSLGSGLVSGIFMPVIGTRHSSLFNQTWDTTFWTWHSHDLQNRSVKDYGLDRRHWETNLGFGLFLRIFLPVSRTRHYSLCKQTWDTTLWTWHSLDMQNRNVKDEWLDHRHREMNLGSSLVSGIFLPVSRTRHYSLCNQNWDTNFWT